MLNGKKILIGVTGSIAAYKSASLVRLLVKSGAEVKVIMTDAATGFITPLTLATLSKNKVASGLFEADTWANHVMLGRWADLMLIAPASCNTISKIASGICDNLLQAVYLSATCPIMLAPAMDKDMWKHPATISNLSKIREYGNIILPVEKGELASGLNGEGRMAEPEAIIEKLETYFKRKTDLIGKRILITAGPTYEPLDPVRFIGNRSTGKMGIALAKECADRGGEVTLILGPSSEPVPQGIHLTQVGTAGEMYRACTEKFPQADIAVMCAAVADYTPVNISKEKIKKTEGSFSLELKRTDDILMKLGQMKTPHQILAGFALETENETENAIAKLYKKNADFIILNSLKDEGAGFGHSTNKIIIFDKRGASYPFELKAKEKAAEDIINTILKKQYA